ncbi:MAG: hypothetical protein AAFV29_13400 [Myxococcota bacterium]
METKHLQPRTVMLPKVPSWRRGSNSTEDVSNRVQEAETVDMALRMLNASQQPLLAVHLVRKLIQFGLMIAPDRLEDLLRFHAQRNDGLWQDDLGRWRTSPPFGAR